MFKDRKLKTLPYSVTLPQGVFKFKDIFTSNEALMQATEATTIQEMIQSVKNMMRLTDTVTIQNVRIKSNPNHPLINVLEDAIHKSKRKINLLGHKYSNPCNKILDSSQCRVLQNDLNILINQCGIDRSVIHKTWFYHYR